MHRISPKKEKQKEKQKHPVALVAGHHLSTSQLLPSDFS